MQQRKYTPEGLRIFTSKDADRYAKESLQAEKRGENYWYVNLGLIGKKDKDFFSCSFIIAKSIVNDHHKEYFDKDELTFRLLTAGATIPYISLGGLEEKNFPLVSKELIIREQSKLKERVYIGGREAARQSEDENIAQITRENPRILETSREFIKSGWYNLAFVREAEAFTAIIYDFIKKQIVYNKKQRSSEPAPLRNPPFYN